MRINYTDEETGQGSIDTSAKYSDTEIRREAHRLANTFLDHLHVPSWGTALVLNDEGYRRLDREIGRIQGEHRRLSQPPRNVKEGRHV